MFSQMTARQVDQSVTTALFGDLIEFANPWLGLSLWAVYAGEGQVIHFGVGDENMTQKACRSLLQQMVPKSNGEQRVLKETKVCVQRIEDLKLPAGTRIRVNNNKHNLAPTQPEWMKYRCDTLLQHGFKYDLMSFNSEHFATFIRYGQAVCNQNPFKRKNEVHMATTQTLQRILQQRMETEAAWVSATVPM